jgi:amino acid permease
MSAILHQVGDVDANDADRMEEGASLGAEDGSEFRENEGTVPHAGQKPGMAVFNLSSCIIGAGIMAIPNAFRVLGVLGGVLALCAMHVVTTTTVRFLVHATEASGAATYAACARRYCGDAARTAVQLAIVLNNFGIMVVYQIIFGDVLAGTPADLRTLPDVDPGPGSDAGDYSDDDDYGNNNTDRVYPPPTPPAAPPSDEDDADAAPAALLPWAFARAGGSCRVVVANAAPHPNRPGLKSHVYPHRSHSSYGTTHSFVGAADDGLVGYGERTDTFIARMFALEGHPGGSAPGALASAPASQNVYETRWYCARPASIAYVLFAVCAPLCLMRSLKSLAGASFVSVMCAANFAAVLLFKFLVHVSEVFEGADEDATFAAKMSALTPRLLPDPDRTNVREAISCIAVMTTAYVCHFVVHPLYAEMNHPKTPARFEKAVTSRALGLCTCIYVGVGTVAFALFGDGTHADVLVDFRRNTAMDQAVVKGGYVVSLALTYPVLFCVMREVIVEIWEDFADGSKDRSNAVTGSTAVSSHASSVDEATSDELREHLLTDGGAEEDASFGGAGEDAGLGGGANAGTDGDDENANRIPMRDSLVSLRDPEECGWRLSRPAHVVLTLSIIAVQFLLAIVTPNIEVALGFMGSTLSVFVAFIAPALIARGAAIEAGASTGVSTAVLAFGFAVGASGLTVATWNAVSPPK